MEANVQNISCFSTCSVRKHLGVLKAQDKSQTTIVFGVLSLVSQHNKSLLRIFNLIIESKNQ